MGSIAAMEEYFERMERVHYLPEGTPKHGFDGMISVRVQQTPQIAGCEC